MDTITPRTPLFLHKTPPRKDLTLKTLFCWLTDHRHQHHHINPTTGKLTLYTLPSDHLQPSLLSPKPDLIKPLRHETKKERRATKKDKNKKKNQIHTDSDKPKHKHRHRHQHKRIRWIQKRTDSDTKIPIKRNPTNKKGHPSRERDYSVVRSKIKI